MPDYLHRLEFGTFITPSPRTRETPVALAQISEAAGLDLVTFQDHPYQPAFLDTWTLMTFVAARTDTHPDRPPTCSTCRCGRPPSSPAPRRAWTCCPAAASISALGAGGFWDAIEAMGGRRLDAGPGGDGARGGDRRHPRRLGRRASAAARSPTASTTRCTARSAVRRPAHDIPIWIGAYKPRMLRLTGRKADGWLPSLGYLKPGDLAAGNAKIDEAAAAGRSRSAGDPAPAQRLRQVPAADLGNAAGSGRSVGRNTAAAGRSRTASAPSSSRSDDPRDAAERSARR